MDGDYAPSPQGREIRGGASGSGSLGQGRFEEDVVAIGAEESFLPRRSATPIDVNGHRPRAAGKPRWLEGCAAPSGSGAVLSSRHLPRPKPTWATPRPTSRISFVHPASDWRMKVDQIARCIRVAWLLCVAEPWLRNSCRFGSFLESVPGPYPLLSASVEATFHAGQATAGATRAARRRLR